MVILLVGGDKNTGGEGEVEKDWERRDRYIGREAGEKVEVRKERSALK